MLSICRLLTVATPPPAEYQVATCRCAAVSGQCDASPAKQPATSLDKVAAQRWTQLQATPELTTKKVGAELRSSVFVPCRVERHLVGGRDDMVNVAAVAQCFAHGRSSSTHGCHPRPIFATSRRKPGVSGPCERLRARNLSARDRAISANDSTARPRCRLDSRVSQGMADRAVELMMRAPVS